MTNRISAIYFDINKNYLQIFFAVMSVIEKIHAETVLIIDDYNKEIVEECLKLKHFRTITKKDYSLDYKTIKIEAIHNVPTTYIGSLPPQPLYFPNLILNRYFSSLEKKNDRIYFRGSITSTRFRETFYFLCRVLDIKGIYLLLKNLSQHKRNFIISTNKVYFHFTNRGRFIEHKYIDADYYKEMSNYKFVFCPKGDFVWTYRFFEAIQVGSIPICNYKDKLYDNFAIISGKAKQDSFPSQNIIDSNIQLFVKKYTLNIDPSNYDLMFYPKK